MNQDTTDKTSKQQKEEQDKQLFEHFSFQFGKDLDRYLLYMSLIVMLETFLQKNVDGVLKTNRIDVENIIINWIESFRKAVLSLFEKDDQTNKQLAITVLNLVTNSTREKLFKLITIPPESIIKTK